MNTTERSSALILLWLAIAVFFFAFAVVPVARPQSNTCNNGDMLLVNTGGNKNNQCLPVNSQPAGTGTTMQITNDTVTGTTVNRLAKLTGAPSKALITATTDTENAIGIVTAGAGITGSATVTILGQASCEFDGATTAGNYFTISATTAGKCHDGGSTWPQTGATYGRVLTTNGGAGTYTVEIMTPDVAFQNAGNGKSKPGSPSNSVQFNGSGNVFTGASDFTYTTGALSVPSLTITGAAQHSGDISATISADTDDWAPTGLSTASVIRVNVTGTFNLTGITGGTDGRLLTVINVGSFGNVLTLKNNNSGSSAGNKFNFGVGDITLHGGVSITLIYDSTSSLWRPLNVPELARYYAVNNGNAGSPSFTFINNTGNGMHTDGGNIVGIDAQGGVVANFLNVSGTTSFQASGQNGVGNGGGAGVTSGFAAGPSTGQAKWIREGTTNAGTLYFPTRTMAAPAGVPTPDLTQGNVQRHTLTANTTFGAASNMVDGIEFTIVVQENGAGGHTVAWDTTYKWVGGVAPTHTATANAIDIFRFWTNGTNAYEISRALDVK